MDIYSFVAPFHCIKAMKNNIIFMVAIVWQAKDDALMTCLQGNININYYCSVDMNGLAIKNRKVVLQKICHL